MKVKKYSYIKRLQNTGYLFILPAVIMFLIFVTYPVGNSIFTSFFRWNMTGPKIFVGFSNYIRALKDPQFLNALVNSLQFVAACTVLTIIISFSLAYALTRIGPKIRRIFQTLFFVPSVLSTVGVLMGWRLIFHGSGILNVLFRKFFNLDVNWLTSTQIAPISAVVVYLWFTGGFYMILFLAGLLNIPIIYYEAAEIDGAGFWTKLIHITIPQMKTTMSLVFLSVVIFTFGSFPIQWVLLDMGGPARATEVLPILIFRAAFINTRIGYASALSIIFFLILLTFSIIQLRINRVKE